MQGESASSFPPWSSMISIRSCFLSTCRPFWTPSLCQNPSRPNLWTPNLSRPSLWTPVLGRRVFRGFVIRGRRGRAGRLLGVIRHIPARSLELHRRSGDHQGDRSATVRAFLHVGIGKLLDLFKTVMALLALVLVKWHGLPEMQSGSRAASRFGRATVRPWGEAGVPTLRSTAQTNPGFSLGSVSFQLSDPVSPLLILGIAPISVNSWTGCRRCSQ